MITIEPVTSSPKKSAIPTPSTPFLPRVYGSITPLFVPTSRRRLICLVAFALLWIVELYWVQRVTLVPRQGVGPRYAFWAPQFRLALDIFFVAAFCSLLRARYLLAIALFMLVVNVGLTTYANCFRRPLSILTILTTWREGIDVGHFVLSWIPVGPGLLLAAAFLIKAGLLYMARSLTIPLKLRFSASGAAILAYSMLFAVTMYIDPLNRILSKRGVGRLGYIRGYLGPWCAELYYLNDPRLMKIAIDRVHIVSDILTPVETAIPIHKRLVIIQVESLDYNVLQHRVDGQEVTPFLDHLRQRSLFYKVRAYHVMGSADADFTMLAGGPPALNVLNYNLPNFPYDNTLPQFLGRFGFQTSAFHGNWGQFYNRRPAFEKMGFADICFREDLEQRANFIPDLIGLRDRDVMMFSSLSLRKAVKPTCHFIITLTSHTPYRFLKPEEQQIVPRPADLVDSYFNHIHYVDMWTRVCVTISPRSVRVSP
jgi:hypothetical protein